MKKPYLMAFLALFVVHQASVAESSDRISEARMVRKIPKAKLTDDQREYLGKYCKYRAIALKYFGLGRETTLEQLRPRLAKWLGLSKDASWNDFYGAKFVKKVAIPLMTEERRERFAMILCGRWDATWIEMLFALEKLRIRRDAGEIASNGFGAAGAAFFATGYTPVRLRCDLELFQL